MGESIQSLIFNKNKWTISQAEGWLTKHGYKKTFYGKKVDITPNYYRYRQLAPHKFQNYFIKLLDGKNEGIGLVIGYNNPKL